MKLRFAAVLCLLLALSRPGLADEQAALAQTSCSILQAGDSWIVYCYAQVVNGTDSTLCLEQGDFEVLSGDGVLGSGTVEQLSPYFLGPGEEGYLFDALVLEDAADAPQVTGLSYDLQYLTVDPLYSSRSLPITAELLAGEDGLTAELTIENDQEATVWSPALAFGLFTEGGSLLFADGRTLENVGVPSGAEAIVRFDIAPALLERWAEFGAEPAEVRASCAFGGDDD